MTQKLFQFKEGAIKKFQLYSQLSSSYFAMYRQIYLTVDNAIQHSSHNSEEK